MKRQTTLTVSCGRVLKAKAQTMIFTQVQSDDKDDKKKCSISNYIRNDAEENIAQTYHINLIEDGEVNKLIKFGFIQEVKYPTWIFSIVPVVKLYPSWMDRLDTTKYNADATYQRAIQKICDDMLHKNVECYVDDLVVKSKKRENHFHDLRKAFEHLRRNQLKMNPSQYRRQLENAKTAKHPQAQKFATKASISPEVYFKSSRSLSTIQPFDEKNVPFQWDEACDKVFKTIKSYLMKPTVLVAPVLDRPLILYVATQERSVGILLAQKNDEGKENALYYLSRTMTPNELKY
ncbi:hypothetical protein Sango_3015100 [Sesamum angolense]|uniref:Reverse transcriptase/retrotransposon-derived protein RNase H-like domain-containing protein n=1 Tax=Sesamum angolense TaxID=2727404 RepID=A0AAE1T3F5_9LAMI|nr:hypothetical protein Sango_3015100 [Sesamum angolense]